MSSILNQFRRIMSDDGRGDRDFTTQESRLRYSQENLRAATEQLVRASNELRDTIRRYEGGNRILN